MGEDTQLFLKIVCLVIVILICVYEGPSALESAQFWMWLLLVILVIVVILAILVIFLIIIDNYIFRSCLCNNIQVRFLKKNNIQPLPLQMPSQISHPFMIAQLSTIGMIW